MGSHLLGMPNFSFASDHSLLVTFGNEITQEVHRDVVRLSRLLLEESTQEILNIHPAYSSVLITFDPRITSPSKFEGHIRRLMKNMDSIEIPQSQSVEIPVCYEGDFAPDLEDVAHYNSLSKADVVRLHSSTTYIVYFLGFTPGFPYLGGMPKEITMPRRPTPRRLVHAGSVAIGGHQTGVYPVSSPGGWQIIGRTPRRLFNPEGRHPTLLQMGDHVRFVPISREKYETLNAQRNGSD